MTTLRQLKEGKDSVDVIKMDVPLFIRMLEFAREDAKSDEDLHFVTTNAVEKSKNKTHLNMDDYNELIRI